MKRFIFVITSGLVALIVGGSLITTANQPSIEEVANQGLNEFIDPSQSPKYEQEFTTIEFSDPLTKEQVVELDEVAPVVTKETTDDTEEETTLHTQKTETETEAVQAESKADLEREVKSEVKTKSTSLIKKSPKNGERF